VELYREIGNRAFGLRGRAVRHSVVEVDGLRIGRIASQPEPADDSALSQVLTHPSGVVIERAG
jgi:hypothetical protein